MNRRFPKKGRFGGLYASYLAIGDDSYVVALTQAFAEDIEQGGFPRAHRPADTDFDASVWHMESPTRPRLPSSPVGKGGESTGLCGPIPHPHSLPIRANISFETADCITSRAAWREYRNPELHWTGHPSSVGECHRRWQGDVGAGL